MLDSPKSALAQKAVGILLVAEPRLPEARSILKPADGKTHNRGKASSEAGGRTGRDQLADLLAQIAEAMRQAAVEVIGLPRSQHAALIAHGDLELAADHDRPLLRGMAQHGLPGVRPRLV